MHDTLKDRRLYAVAVVIQYSTIRSNAWKEITIDSVNDGDMRCICMCLETIKPGFHYPSWRPELMGGRFPLPVNTEAGKLKNIYTLA